MEYRAIAIGQMNEGHQIQIYGTDLSIIRKWAREVSVARKCVVEIYESHEALIETVDKP